MQSLILNGLKYIATLASGLGKNKKLFILIYHRVLDEPDYMRPGEIDRRTFTWQMDLMAKYFNVLPLAEALEKIQNNELPARAVCITFDDGYADNYQNALPILNAFNLNATFFIANGFLNGGMMWNDKVIEAVRAISSEKIDLSEVGLGVYDVSSRDLKSKVAQEIINKIKHQDSSDRLEIADFVASKVKNLPSDLMMTDEQLIQLHNAGMEIGGHTVNHPIMAKLKTKALSFELKNNKLVLEQLLGTTIRFFAYPNGKPEIDYKQKHVVQVKSEGYQAALSTQWGVSDKNSDLFQLPRFTPWDQSPIKFMQRMILLYL